MSTSEDVDKSGEKLPPGEHFNHALEGEKSQLQPPAPTAQQVNHSVQHCVIFAPVLFHFKTKLFCQMNRSWDLWPKQTDLTHTQTVE